ncbi:MAG: hypothetical protein EOO92_12775 [Pedobacter sp.]|nr:MAG: hypothetical protein EOO92_12775 [Pedobacter sp.]
MNFLYPGFLFALLAIAIPIVIHLFNFRKFKKVYFSNVQFLKEAKEQNSSREKLKHLLVLISRILAITFLVLAFARPFISSGERANPAGRNVINIYIDNSYSMETVNKEGNLLDEAKRKAKLDEIKISAASRSLQQVINRQQSQTNQDNHITYLLSDFQTSFVGSKQINSKPDVSVNFIKLNANALPNITVDSVWSLSPVHQPDQAEKMLIRLRNYGTEDAKDIPVKLSINGQQKSIGNVAVPAGKSITDTLSFSGLKAGWQKGIASIKDFPLTFDDQLNFTFNVSKEMKILSISGNPSEKFIRALFGADAYFNLTEMPESNIKYTTFSEYSLIVLSNLQSPSSGLAQQLKAFVQNGGTVVVFPNLEAGSANNAALLSGLSLPAIEQLNTGNPVNSTIDLKNDLFKDVFDQVPKNLDLPLVNRYFSYLSQNSSPKENILQLPLNRFLLARYRSGAGQIYLSATSLDPKDGNLARHPVFVPLMYKIAFGSARNLPLYYTTGTSDVLESAKIELLKNQSLKLVSDQFEAIPDVRQTPGKTLLYVADQVKKSGFYELKNGQEVLSVLAFNDNRTESNMEYAGEDELNSLFGTQKINIYNSKKDAQSLQMSAQNNSTELWKLCIILTLVFLAAEILLIRFFNTQKNKIA